MLFRSPLAAPAPRRARGCAGQVNRPERHWMHVRSAVCELRTSPFGAGPSPAVRFHRVAACRPRRFTTMHNPRQILAFAPWQDGLGRPGFSVPITRKLLLRTRQREKAWRDAPEHRQPLASNTSLEQQRARDITAWLRQAGDEARADRVGDACEHNRNRAGLFLQRACNR